MFTNELMVQIFSPAQIAGIVIVAIVFVALVVTASVFAYLLHKRGERRLYDLELERRRALLLAKLKLMREGNYEYANDEPEEESTDEAEEVAIIVDEGDAVEEEVEEATGKVLRYNRSFTARITQASNDVKGYYSELKNYILSYTGIKGAVSWKHESFRKGRAPVASFMVRGKTLCLCLATDPRLFEGTKYKVDDLSERNKTTKYPTVYRLKSDRRVSYAKELIDIVMEEIGLKRAEDYKNEDFTLPYKSTEVLIKAKLIKVVGGAAADISDAAAAKKGISYNRSFTAKIIQSNDALKAGYSELKNYMLAYEGVVAKSSWKREAYLSGRTCVASVVIRGKTLCLCLATDPEKFKMTKYRVENLAERNKNAYRTPCMYRVNGVRKMQFAKELIDIVFGTEYGLKKVERETVDYVVPYVSTNNLIAKNLIRVVKGKPFRFRGDDNEEDETAVGQTVVKPKPATKPETEKPTEEKPAEAEAKPVEAAKPRTAAKKAKAVKPETAKPEGATEAQSSEVAVSEDKKD